MHQAGAVDVAERVGEPVGQQTDAALGQGPEIVADDLVQGGTGDVAGGDPRHRAFGVGVEHGGGPPAADAAGRGDFQREPPPEVRLLGERGPDRLDGDGAAPLRTGQVDLPHAPLAEPAEQPVRTDAVRVLWHQPVHVEQTPPKVSRGCLTEDRGERGGRPCGSQPPVRRRSAFTSAR